ncbi:hypothetical protein [Paraburkholderia caledonica]|uniref:hypothetical protein n=1 Tax=Paraburkholderia caledonica TaxID=134536 RepID=UPI0038B9639C
MKNSITAQFGSKKDASLARNSIFDTFVWGARTLAEQSGLHWDIPLDGAGVALPDHAWDLRKLVNDGRPQPSKLQTFSQSESALRELSEAGLRNIDIAVIEPVSVAWQDLIKAHAIEHILVRGKTPAYIQQAANAWRFLATVANKEPWLVTADDVILACKLSDKCQPSGGRSVVLISLFSSFVDTLHLFDACPLKPLISSTVKGSKKRVNLNSVAAGPSRKLADRKKEQRLPELRAFWELVRIVFTESPRSFNDALRFAMVKILLFTGLRVGEVVLLPLDCLRTRAFFDAKGRSAGDVGGISDSLSLRHFAEKQGTTALYEATQHVPEIFREELEKTIELVISLTAPLRATLEAQCASGRIFPMYKESDLVEVTEMYTRVTGCSVYIRDPDASVREAVERYRQRWDVEELQPLAELQSGATRLSPAVSAFYDAKARSAGLVVRDSSGEPDNSHGLRGKKVLVGDAERFIAAQLPNRISHLSPLRLENGEPLEPWKMLFLFPKEINQARTGLPTDPRYVAGVDIAEQAFLQQVLGGSKGIESLFSVYGKTEEDKILSIKSHSLRHLQNTELFRLGIADTVISKRFNRRSVVQSYEYDHRSLAEELDQLELPDAWADIIGSEKVATVAKLIEMGRTQGPIVREFKRIQAEEGDDAALRFLVAEADGFHATPYGFCLNSFTVDPCPKHLECFTGCRHLSATDLPENRRNVVVLHGRLKQALEKAEARPPGSVGRENQIAHGRTRLEGVERLMTTRPGAQVFPEGPDLSQPNQPRSVLYGT